MTVKFGEVTLKTEIEGDVLSLSAGDRRRLFKILDTIKTASSQSEGEPRRRRRRKQTGPDPAALSPDAPEPPVALPEDSEDVPF